MNAILRGAPVAVTGPLDFDGDSAAAEVRLSDIKAGSATDKPLLRRKYRREWPIESLQLTDLLHHFLQDSFGCRCAHLLEGCRLDNLA